VSPRPTGRGGALCENKPSTPRPRPHDESWDEAERRVTLAALRLPEPGLRHHRFRLRLFSATRCVTTAPAGAGTIAPAAASGAAEPRRRVGGLAYLTALFYRTFLPRVLPQ
jgi:hypothetical protein